MSLKSLPLEIRVPGSPVFPVDGVGPGIFEEGRCQWRGLVLDSILTFVVIVLLLQELTSQHSSFLSVPL